MVVKLSVESWYPTLAVWLGKNGFTNHADPCSEVACMDAIMVAVPTDVGIVSDWLTWLCIINMYNCYGLSQADVHTTSL